jgi:4-hydroxy-tetrahydrodipicolinate reductase
MNIAIIGYGKMGKEIRSVAIDQGLTVRVTIDPLVKEADFSDITEESVRDIDVGIEFTAPSVTIDNIKKMARVGKNIVVGTTGWYERMDEVRKIVEEGKIGFVYASNFSLGTHLFFKMVEEAARLFNKYEMYDVFSYELHHNQKVDSPSGTAKTIGKILIDHIDRKKKLVFDKLDRRIEKDELHLASVRGGSLPGIHVVGFDSDADTIELKHEARSRRGFAMGAVLAAKWLQGKRGFYTMADVLK